MKPRILIVTALVCGYCLVVAPFARYMNNRPIAIRLGFMPEAKLLKLVAADYKQLLAQQAIVRVLFYFGTVVDPDLRKVNSVPDYFQMFTTLQQAVLLDPYNIDAYYFAEAAYTWELHKIKEVNNLLDFGMKYRIWDPQLPFYAAFNCAYFEKDYISASKYMKMAAERSDNPLFTNLAARYFHEAGLTEVGIAFVEQMDKTTIDPRIKKLYQLRRDALRAVQRIEKALQSYKQHVGHLPVGISQLVSEGYLDQIPHDPYGGEFYITSEGHVRSTSKFAFAGKKSDENKAMSPNGK
ncbi:hypothetical protein [Geotalea sp. SG265]|uniref:hypothetical protein n=1 Tax=Geotalea sp. SG265 TaxID=2922867 RepID=UPI001FAF78F3|nr:hypothetical protein [Geotalea sp. SG265]